MAADSHQDDVTLGELSRGLVALERRIAEQFVSVQARFDGLSFVSRDVYEVQTNQLIDRLEVLEEARRWMVRTLVASFLFPTLVAVVVALVISR